MITFSSQTELNKYLTEELQIPPLLEEIPSPPAQPQPQEQWDQQEQDQQETPVQPRRTSASQIDEFFDDDTAVDANLWAADVESEVIETNANESVDNKDIWPRNSNPGRDTWTAEDLINDTTCLKGTSTYVSPVSLRNMMDDEVFIKPEPVENRLAMWEDITTSVRHLNPEESNNAQLSSSVPSSVSFIQQSQAPVLGRNRPHHNNGVHQHYPPVSLHHDSTQQFMPYHNASQGHDVKLEDSSHIPGHLQSNEIPNLLTSPSPPLVRPNFNSPNTSQSQYRYSQPCAVSPMVSIPNSVGSSAHRMYTPPTPPSSDQGSPGDLHAHYPPHFPANLRRTPPPPYTAASSNRTSLQQTVSTPVTSLSPSQRHKLPDFSSNTSLQQRLQPSTATATSVSSTSPTSHDSTSNPLPSIGRGSYSPNIPVPSGSGGMLLPARGQVNSPNSSSNASSSSLSSSPLPKYCRRNNPELEKRRIHHCDFPGNYFVVFTYLDIL